MFNPENESIIKNVFLHLYVLFCAFHSAPPTQMNIQHHLCNLVHGLLQSRTQLIRQCEHVIVNCYYSHIG